MTRTTAPVDVPRPRRPDRGPRARAASRSIVVAAAGYGKSTFAEADAADADVLRIDAGRALRSGLDDDPPGRSLVVEDLHRLTATEQEALVERVASVDGTVAVTLTSREPLPPGARARWVGPVSEIGPAELALSPGTVAAVLAEEYGLDDPELPSLVHRATAGWPMLVHLAAEAAARRPSADPVAALGQPGSAVAEWLHAEVLAPLPSGVVDLLAAVADLDPLTPALVDHVLGSSRWAAPGAVDRLLATGLLVPDPRATLVGRDELRLVPVLRSVLEGMPSEARSDPTRLSRAAEWFESHDLGFAAVDAWWRAGRPARAEELLVKRGARMIAQGDGAAIIAFLASHEVGSSPAGGLDPGVRQTLGVSLNHAGQAYAALGTFAPLVDSADRDGWDAGLAVSVAAVHFSQGDLPLARDTLDRIGPDDVPDNGEGIQWRAARSNIASMLGDDDRARELAAAALQLAGRSGAPADLTAAHQAVAKTSSGSRKSAHLAMALSAARDDGDAVSVARILGNQSYALLAEAQCEAAVAVSREAVLATELVRPMGALTAALHNLAEALTRVGELDEARWHLRRAAAVSQRLGPNRGATSMCGLGDVHRALGQREQGRAAYEEAVTLARTSQELQVLVPALSGLARLVLDVAPDKARAAAEEAHALAPRSLAPYALIALGWVELHAGDRGRAADLAREAAEAAREQRARDLLAEALELAAETEEPARARDSLTEALSIWRGGGADPDASRIEVLLGRLEGADRGDRERGRRAAERLQRLGVTTVNGRSFGSDPVGKDVTVAVLGRFEVTVSGTRVPLQAWKSKQARTLMKILAGRRGRPVSRSLLCELLWPGDDPIKTSHRLSVLLTTVRTVLDPAKSWPADHYVNSNTNGVWLDLRRLTLDADELLADADHGATLLADGDTAAARSVLEQVDALYRGEAFDDEESGDWAQEGWAQEDWAQALREDTRAAWLRSLRHLATIATREGRSNDATATLTRLLGVDPYDERVHRGLVRNLVRAGRHGEARRAFARWVQAMAEVDVPPPDPSELEPRRPGSGAD
ncbi:MAG: BTAD domain-containing putative transcriptional regulator [Nocardioidaceae bacterium]